MNLWFSVFVTGVGT